MSDKTREEFEEWCRSNDGFVQADLSKVGGEYCTGFMQCSYASWQAAKELYAPREVELEELLKAAACPDNCTDGAYADNYGEPVQCQFCYEREQLTATKEPQ